MSSRSVSAQAIIDRFELVPLPKEGGFFRQTLKTLDQRESTGTPVSTAILYLLTPDSWSALHLLTEAELYHFYLGDPVHLVTYRGEVGVEHVTLGQNVFAGQTVQHYIPPGSWHGSRLESEGRWALLGTTMAPGFSSAGFSLVRESDLDDLPESDAEHLRPFLAGAQ